MDITLQIYEKTSKLIQKQVIIFACFFIFVPLQRK